LKEEKVSIKEETPPRHKEKGNSSFAKNSIGLLCMRSSNVLEVPVNHNWRKSYISKLCTLPWPCTCLVLDFPAGTHNFKNLFFRFLLGFQKTHVLYATHRSC